MNCVYEVYVGCLFDECVVGCLCEVVGLYGLVCEYLQCMLIGLVSNGLYDLYLDCLWLCLQEIDVVNVFFVIIDVIDVMDVIDIVLLFDFYFSV